MRSYTVNWHGFFAPELHLGADPDVIKPVHWDHGNQAQSRPDLRGRQANRPDTGSIRERPHTAGLQLRRRRRWRWVAGAHLHQHLPGRLKLYVALYLQPVADEHCHRRDQHRYGGLQHIRSARQYPNSTAPCQRRKTEPALRARQHELSRRLSTIAAMSPVDYAHLYHDKLRHDTAALSFRHRPERNYEQRDTREQLGRARPDHHQLPDVHYELDGLLGLSSATGPERRYRLHHLRRQCAARHYDFALWRDHHYTYNDNASPPNKLAMTTCHGTETVMDGFGRTIQTITGYGTSPPLPLLFPPWTPNTRPVAARRSASLPAIAALCAGRQRRLDRLHYDASGPDAECGFAGQQHDHLSYQGTGYRRPTRPKMESL